MVRWEPGAAGRLRAAAMDLFVERGFENTTAADIAQSVGLTERTFFRHFSDKREVLFDGQDVLQDAFLDGVSAAPQDATPLELVASALTAAATFFADDGREYSRRRQLIISANPALQERELLKLAGLATRLAAALRARSISEPAATLAAESGVTVFGVAFGQWIAEGEQRSFLQIEHEVLGELAAMAAGAVSPDPFEPAHFPDPAVSGSVQTDRTPRENRDGHDRRERERHARWSDSGPNR